MPPLAQPTRPPTAVEIQRVTPSIEVWRANGNSPQVPQRRGSSLERAYIVGAEPVVLRVKFDPLSAGKLVSVIPGRGTLIDSSSSLMTISSTGECLVSVQLVEARGHIIVYCQGLKTVLPLSRASLAMVRGREEQPEAGR